MNATCSRKKAQILGIEGRAIGQRIGAGGGYAIHFTTSARWTRFNRRLYWSPDMTDPDWETG